MVDVNRDRIVAARATYQGLPLVACEFSNTPGLSPDSGTGTMLIRNFESLEINVVRPLFSRSFPLAGTGEGTNPIYSGGAVIDASAINFAHKGTLRFESDVGTLEIEEVYIRQDGLQEIETFSEEIGGAAGKVSLVQIQFVDEREWWGKFGWIFGDYNKVGNDGNFIEVTLQPGPNIGPKQAWELKDLLKLGVENLASNWARLAETPIQTDDPEPQQIPRDIRATFENPSHFIGKLIEAYKLTPVKSLSGELSFWKEGLGKTTAAILANIAPELVISNKVVRSPNYTPDAVLIYAQYPTVKEEQIEFGWILDGVAKDAMILVDPRDGSTKPWREALPYYGMTIAEFIRYGSMDRSTHKSRYAQRRVAKYIKKEMRPDDKISTIRRVRRPREYLQDEIERRTSLLNEYAFKTFQIPEEHFAKLPAQGALLRQDASGKPLPRKIEVATHQIIDHQVNPDKGKLSVKVGVWVNTELEEYNEGPGTFQFESNTGIIKFNKVQGWLAVDVTKKIVPGAGAPAPFEVTGVKHEYLARKPNFKQALKQQGVGNIPKEQFALFPPPLFRFTFAYELKGLRDFRASPGNRSRKPDDVVSMHLQHARSPEDHHIKTYDRIAREIPLGVADLLIPQVEQVEGGRRLEPLADDSGDEHTAERDAASKANEELETEMRRIAHAVADPIQDSTIRGRHLIILGFHNIECDGVVQNVKWQLQQDGTPTTMVTMGSARLAPRFVAGLATHAKQHYWKLSQGFYKEGTPAKTSFELRQLGRAD